jgi:hypothetical protein
MEREGRNGREKKRVLNSTFVGLAVFLKSNAASSQQVSISQSLTLTLYSLVDLKYSWNSLSSY